MSLGLGSTLSKGGLATPGIVTSDLVLKHKYDAGGVVPVSDGAAYFFYLDHIEISAVTMDTDGNCSFVFWAKRTEVSSEDAVIGHTSTAGYQNLRFNSNTTMVLESATLDEATITLNSPNDFNWHHYAIICTSGAVTAYQDGVSCSVSNPDMGSDTIFNLIGAASTDGDSKNFQGYLCNVGLWSNALTQTQIKSIMWKNFGALTDTEKNLGLMSWWNFSENAEDPQGGNNGTLAD